MRVRIVVWGLLLCNLALTAALVYSVRQLSQASFPGRPPSSKNHQLTHSVKTNVVVRRQYFSWSQLESPDYETYIENLREIDCPEATIRDIILADVNQLYARKQEEVLETTDQQWWRSDADADLNRTIGDRLDALEEERRELLTHLLGADWDKDYLTMREPREAVPLTGPVLGDLTEETRQQVQRIHAEGRRRLYAYLESAEAGGQPVNQAELARIRQQTRKQLAQLLSPQELEAYLLRYSHNAQQLRAELRGFHATPEEFRNIFRVRDPIDMEIQLQYSGEDPASVERRKALLAQRDTAVRNVLSPDRYEEYALRNEPLYQRAQQQLQQIGAAPDLTRPVFKVNQATERQLEEIRDNPNLTEEERETALLAVQKARAESLRDLMGEELFEEYVDQLQQTRGDAESRDLENPGP
jgi:hypothetical protein